MTITPVFGEPKLLMVDFSVTLVTLRRGFDIRQYFILADYNSIEVHVMVRVTAELTA